MPSKTQWMWACSRSVMTTLAVVTSEHPLKLVGGPGVEDLLDPVRRGKELRETGLAMRSVPALAIAGRRQAAKTASEASDSGLRE
jgi:hypothetical protein